MNIPKPGPHPGHAPMGITGETAGKSLTTKLNETFQKNQKAPKKPFVRKEHLTHRPFVNPALVGFRKDLPDTKKK